MVNILIADNDINYAVNLMNKLNEVNNNIKVLNISNNENATLNIINNYDNIDLVVFALQMDKPEESDFFRKIVKKDKYINCFIRLTDNQIKHEKSEYGFCAISETKENLDKSIISINKLIEEKSIEEKNNRKSKIIYELEYLEYDLSLKGTQYLINAIEIIADGELGEVYNLERDVYPSIKNLYNSSVHNVKNNVNRANNSMYLKCEIEKLKSYFGFNVDEKPKTKEIINTVVRKI